MRNAEWGKTSTTNNTSSTAISSKGFMLCLTPCVTTPRLSGLTRIYIALSYAQQQKINLAKQHVVFDSQLFTPNSGNHKRWAWKALTWPKPQRKREKKTHEHLSTYGDGIVNHSLTRDKRSGKLRHVCFVITCWRSLTCAGFPSNWGYRSSIHKNEYARWPHIGAKWSLVTFTPFKYFYLVKDTSIFDKDI